MIIGVEGIPGSGKTTVINRLRKSPTPNTRRMPWSGLMGMRDNWKTEFLPRWFPWSNFWDNPQQNCEGFLRWRGQMVRETCAMRPEKPGALIMEGSVLPNYLAMAAKECGYMTEFGVVNFVATERMNNFHTDYPDYLIVLRTSPDVAHQRLLERGYPGDEKVNKDFLIHAHEALQSFLEKLPPDYAGPHPKRVFVVENNGGPEDFPEVIEEIRALYPLMNDSHQGREDVDLEPPTAPVTPLHPRDAYISLMSALDEGRYKLRPSCDKCRLSSPFRLYEGWTGF